MAVKLSRFVSKWSRAALFVGMFASVGMASAAPTFRAPYDAQADGAKQIDAALVSARKEGKRVLVQFGANWCVWCIRLHALFASEERIAARLRESYVVVLIDMNEGRNAGVNERYGKPTRFGLPAIVLLDAEGKPLVTQDTEEFEAGNGHDPKKVLAFLEKWASKSRQ
jgi:thiol:disulfide interchange protein